MAKKKKPDPVYTYDPATAPKRNRGDLPPSYFEERFVPKPEGRDYAKAWSIHVLLDDRLEAYQEGAEDRERSRLGDLIAETHIFARL